MNYSEKNSQRLSVCVINYNGEQYLEKSLSSILAHKEKFEEILLIDNASNDESIPIVKDKFPSVKIIQLDENLGPAAARNVGFKCASCDLIFFLDNDVSIASDCSDRLLREMSENKRAALAMPRILYESDKNVIQYDGADSHFLGLMSLHNQDRLKKKINGNTKKISSLVTACFVVDRKIIGQWDPFDVSFFIYFEDHDLGIRTRIMGYEILAVPTANAYHREGTVGLSLRESGSYSKMRIFCIIRNRWLIILKNYQLKTLFFLAPVFLLYEIFQIIGVLKKGWFAQWIKAFWWIILHCHDIFHKRRMIQKERKIPDNEILIGGKIPFTNKLAGSKLEQIGINTLNRLIDEYWEFAKKIL